jgi:hypothetical protein
MSECTSPEYIRAAQLAMFTVPILLAMFGAGIGAALCYSCGYERGKADLERDIAEMSKEFFPADRAGSNEVRRDLIKQRAP